MRVVAGMQQKFGVTEANLLCGTHPVMDEATRVEMIRRGEEPRPLRHNCSGKHTGMLGHCMLRGLPVEDYVNINHPIQQTILATFAEMVGLRVEQVVLGIDGCSAPNFAVPLRNAAAGYARLCDPSGLPAERAAACRRITRAMTSEPNMVGGPGRFDTILMEIASGRILTKGGAEGFQSIGLMPGALGPGTPALGIAFKIADGDHRGCARPLASIEILRQLGALSRQEADRLAQFDAQQLYNYRNLHIGEIRPVFSLQRS
jgi:L-asparaginase II